MGHRPISQKLKHSRGLWSPDEDRKLRDYVLSNGHACWSSIPAKAGLQRNGKSCRLRWINYLRPGLKRGTFTLEEREIVMTLHRVLGNKWAEISKHLPGRTDNEIKNYWHSNLKGRNNVKVEISHSHIAAQQINSSVSSMSLQSLDTVNSSINSSMTISSVYQQDSTVSNFANGSMMPKLMFAEWLSPEDNQPQQENPMYLGVNDYHTVLPTDSLDHLTSFQVDNLLHDLSFEDSLCSDFDQTNSGQDFGSGNETHNLDGGSFFSDIVLY